MTGLRTRAALDRFCRRHPQPDHSRMLARLVIGLLALVSTLLVWGRA
jgi:hypothetical protein